MASGRTGGGPPAGRVTVVQRFRSDLGLYVHLHCLVTDGAFEERRAEVHFVPAPAPTPERMTAVLAQVHKATAAVAQDDDLDLDPALAACVQLGLAGPHLAPPEPAARPPLTESAFGMHLDMAAASPPAQRRPGPQRPTPSRPDPQPRRRSPRAPRLA